MLSPLVFSQLPKCLDQAIQNGQKVLYFLIIDPWLLSHCTDTTYAAFCARDNFKHCQPPLFFSHIPLLQNSWQPWPQNWYSTCTVTYKALHQRLLSLNSICSINTFMIVLLQHKLAEEKSRTFSGHMSGQVPWTALAVEMSSCLLVTVKFYKCKKDRRKIYGANLECACFHRHV